MIDKPQKPSKLPLTAAMKRAFRAVEKLGAHGVSPEILREVVESLAALPAGDDDA